MPAIDVYTPWQEPPTKVEDRTVGRVDILATLKRSAEQHGTGAKVLPVYLFGPRGCGKSHLITLLRHRLATPDCPVIFVPEDIPVLRSADDLYARIARQRSSRPAWLGRPRPEALPEHAIILFEALHKHLAAFDKPERQKLRARMEDTPGQWWIATGVSLSEPFTSRDEPLFGSFNPFPITPLAAEDGRRLLELLVPVTVSESPSWPGRAQTLSTLAGGSPRTLVALAGACAAEPEAWASDHLHAVVRTVTAHYQMRFADLPPDGQRMVEALSEASGELGPTVLARILGIEVANASKVLRRLAEDGVLTLRERGRNSYYALAEPLFRFWHEYRTSSWDESRVGWVSRLIEALLSPDEMARAWVAAVDDSLVRAIEAIVKNDPAKAVHLIARELGVGGTGIKMSKLCADLAKVEPQKLLQLADATRSADHRRALRPAFAEVPAVLTVWKFEGEAATSPAAAFRLLVVDLAGQTALPPVWRWVDQDVRRVLDAVDQRGAAWNLDADERAALARVPVLRARYVNTGKRLVDAPLLSPRDLLSQGLPNLGADWTQLIVASMRLRDSALWSHLVTSATALFPSPSIPANPLPGQMVPAHPDLWLQLLTGSMRAKTIAAPAALTWAATAAQVDAATYDALLDALRTPLFNAPPNSAQRASIEVALTRLGLQSPERLPPIAGLVLALPWLDVVVDRVTAIVEALRGELLHPELQALKSYLIG